MFGDMFGNMQEKQDALKKQLAEIELEAESGDGAIKVTANAAREIVNISINKEMIDLSDTEQIEDLMMVAINRVLAIAQEREQEESQKLISDMLPPGMGGLKDLFGQ